MRSKDEPLVQAGTEGLIAYEKKMEYGGSKIFASNISITKTENEYLIEEGSDFVIDGSVFLNKKEDVFDLLYNGE